MFPRRTRRGKGCSGTAAAAPHCYSMNVLFIVTSADTLAPGHPTGVWLEEYAIPYMALIEAGVPVTVASPKGGQGPIDPKTAPDAKAAARWVTAARGGFRQYQNTRGDATGRFDAVFVPGGHGPMVDLAVDPSVSSIDQRLRINRGRSSRPCAMDQRRCSKRPARMGSRSLKDKKAPVSPMARRPSPNFRQWSPFLLEDRMRAARGEVRARPCCPGPVTSCATAR